MAEHEHFGHAAAVLGIRQPALSQQIKILEDQLGVRLFERTGKKTLVTRAGHEYLHHARRAVVAAEQAAHAAQRAARGETGRLAIAMVVSAIYRLVPDVLRAFRDDYPDVEVTLQEVPSAEQPGLLSNGDVDVGFFRPPLPRGGRSGLTLLPVLNETLGVFAPADSPLAARDRVDVAALADTPFVLLPQHLEPATYHEIFQICRNRGFEPTISMYAPTVHSALGLVAAGYGVTFGPRSVAACFTQPGVTYVPLTTPATIPHLTLGWRADETEPVVLNFVLVVRRHLDGIRTQQRVRSR